MVALVVAITVFVVALAAELLHARRTRRIAHLAFGPTARPRAWTRWAGLLRAGSLAALAWGLLTLLTIEPTYRRANEMPDAAIKRLIIALDVSPSMQLADAGELKNTPRAKRAGEVIMSVLNRISLDQTRVTVVAFYTGARPVVIDTRDPAIVKNILNDLPLDYAFDPGKTQILEGINTAFEIAKPWRPKSATLMLVSDGDTTPYSGMPPTPPAIARTLVIGVGDAGAGRFIDDHNSRQDVVTLRQLATRLHGTYHNANDRNVPNDLIGELSGLLPMSGAGSAGRREWAIVCVVIGGIGAAFVPVALMLFGSAWRPGVRDVTRPRIAPLPSAALAFGESKSQGASYA